MSQRSSWCRDIGLYGVIASLGAYVATQEPLDSRGWAGIVLAGLLAVKAKLSNGHPDKGPTPVTVENLPGNPVPVEESNP